MERLLEKVDILLEEKSSNDDILSVESENKSEDDNAENDKTTEQINLLINMGFDEKMIRKLYLFLTPHSIEEAVNMLIKEKRIYHHPFYRRESRNSIGNPDLCFICGEEERNHDKNSVIQKRTSSFSKKKDTRNKGEDDLICSICLCTFDKKEIGGHKLSCNHLFCSSCWEEFIREKITVGDFSQLKCMEQGCKVELPIKFVKFFIKNDKELLQNYKILKRKDEILKSKYLNFCPELNCDGYLKKGKDKFTQCQKGHKYCFECLKPWHKGKECESIAELDKKFYEWKAGKRIKLCPNCKMFTEKNEGCNHMICAECHYQWCWLCEKKYTTGHYQSGDCIGQKFVVAKKPNPEYLMNEVEEVTFCEKVGISLFVILFFIAIINMFFFLIFFHMVLVRIYKDLKMVPKYVYGGMNIIILVLTIPYGIGVCCILVVILLPGLFNCNYIKKIFSKMWKHDGFLENFIIVN